jgi:hypothetical protein
MAKHRHAATRALTRLPRRLESAERYFVAGSTTRSWIFPFSINFRNFGAITA